MLVFACFLVLLKIVLINPIAKTATVEYWRQSETAATGTVDLSTFSEIETVASSTRELTVTSTPSLEGLQVETSTPELIVSSTTEISSTPEIATSSASSTQEAEFVSLLSSSTVTISTSTIESPASSLTELVSTTTIVASPSEESGTSTEEISATSTREGALGGLSNILKDLWPKSSKDNSSSSEEQSTSTQVEKEIFAQPREYKFSQKKSDITFTPESDKMLSIKRRGLGETLTFGLDGTDKELKYKNSDKQINYEDVFPGTDFNYDVSEKSLKESIVLKDKSHPQSFKFSVNLSDFDYQAGDQGEITLYSKGHSGETFYRRYVLKAPFMTDASGTKNENLKYEISDDTLTLVLDSEWLKTASYPVIVDPTVEIEVLNVHSHPMQGEDWKVDFTTTGRSDLKISPADEATTRDDEFTSLKCGDEDRTDEAQILDGDVIFVKDWSCDDVAQVTHHTLTSGNHHLVFEFDGETAEAFNAAYTWDGGGADANWNTANNWSSNIVPTSGDSVTFDNTCVTNCSPTINVTSTVTGMTIASTYAGTITQANGTNFTATGAFSQSGGTFIGGNGTNTFGNNFTISGGTFTSASTTIMNGGNGSTININVTQTFYDLQISGVNMNISSGDTVVTNGTLTLSNSQINGGTFDTRGNIVQGSSFTGASTIVDFGNDSAAQTYTINGGRGPSLRFDSAADANDSIVMGAAGGLNTLTITSGFSGAVVITNPSNFGLTVGTFSQAAGTFNGGAGTNTFTGGFTISGGTFNAATTTVFTGNNTANQFNVNVSQTFYNLQTTGTNPNIGSGDTLVVTGTLTLVQSVLSGGTIDTRGNIVQQSGANGGSTVIDFGDDAVVQTYTINGGTTPTVRLDSAGDANDTFVINAAATFSNFTITSGFSGNFIFTNPSNFGMTFTAFSQAGGIWNGGAGNTTFGGTFTLTGGTFNAATTTTFTNGTWTATFFNSTQTFNNVTFNMTNNNGMTLANSATTMVVNGTLTLTDGVVNTGIISAKGNITQASTYDGGTALIDLTNDSSAQTWTINGGTSPGYRLDSAADASDSIVISGNTTFASGSTTSGFSGTIPITDPSNFTIAYSGAYAQAAGTFPSLGAAITFSSTLALSGGTYNGGTGANTFTGAATISGGTFNSTTNASGSSFASGITLSTGTFNQGGEINLTNGAYSQTSGTFNGSTATSTYSRNFTISSGTYNAATTTVFGGSNDYTTDVVTTQTFYNLVINHPQILVNTRSIAAGDTLIVSNNLILVDGAIGGTGTVDARGNVFQYSTADGGGATFNFGNDSASQTYTSNGGIGPVIQFDSAADASDSIVINAATTFEGINITSGFSGTVPISNSSNFDLTLYNFTQAAGTFNGGSGTIIINRDFTITGGTYNASATTTFTTSGDRTLNVNTSQTFNNLTINKNQILVYTETISSGDNIIVTGNLTLTDGVLGGPGTVEARGNIISTSNSDGISAALTLTGSSASGLANQTIDFTSNTGNINADLTINKSEGEAQFLSAIVLDAASQDLFLTAGTLNLNGNNLTVNGSSGTFILSSGSTLKLQGGETITANSGNPQINSNATINFTGTGGPYTIKQYTYGNLTISGSASFSTPSTTATTTGSFLQSAGTFTAPSSALNVYGNFTHSGGTFTHNSGTVLLNGLNQTVTGTTTFYNLTKSTSTAATLTFGSDQTQTIANVLTLSGASGNLLSLRSTSTGTQWKIDPQGTRTISYLDVKDSNNINATSINAVGTNSTNSGNNTNWDFDPVITQSDFRWFASANTSPPSTTIGSQNSTGVIVSVLSPVRLLMNLFVSSFQLPTSSLTFKLQVSSSTSNGWSDVSSFASSAPWYSSAWQNRRKITFNNSAASADLTNYPVMVALNAIYGNFDYTKTKAAGADIRFTDSDGTTLLNYEIEKWDPTGTSTIWVKVPTISAASTTDNIYMYYNNSSATDNSTTTGVWDSTFAGVWHLGDTSGTTILDSTNQNNGTKNSASSPAASSTGLLDGAQQFNPSDFINVGTSISINKLQVPMTISGWFYASSSSGTFKTLFAQYNTTTSSRLIKMIRMDSANLNLTYYMSTNSGGFQSVTYSGTPSTGTWHYVSIAVSGTIASPSVSFTVDNSSQTFTPAAFSSTPDSTVMNRIGNDSTSSTTPGAGFRGTLDEWRISSSTRNADWKSADYKNGTLTYSTYGSEESNWKFYDNTSLSDSSTISATSLSTSNVKETYQESNPSLSNPNAVGVGQYGEWDWSLNPVNILAGITYYFRMVTGTGTTLNNYTNYPSLLYLGENAPDAPSSLSPATGGWANSSTPTLSFSLSDPDGGDTVKFQIQIDDSSDFSSPLIDYTSALGAQGARSFTVGQAAGGGSYAVSTSTLSDSSAGYYWRVMNIDNSAVQSAFTTANSGSVAFKVDTVSPSAGTLSVASTSATSLTASVSGASDALSGLSATPYIFYNTTSSTNSGATSSTSWLSSGLTPNTQYTFRVQTNDTAGNSATSSAVSRYTLANIPTSPSASAASQTAISFSWNANSNPGGTEYYPINTTSSSSPGWISTTNTTFSGLTCGTSYTFTVKAHNADGFETAATSPVTAETQACDPSAPGSFGTSEVTSGGFLASTTPHFTFSISDPTASSTVRFQIQISTATDFSTQVIDYTSALGAQGTRFFTVGQAAGGGSYSVGSSATTLSDASYYWRIKSTNNSGFSSAFVTANSGAIAFVNDLTGPTAGSISVASTSSTSLTATISGAGDSGSSLSATPYIFYNQTATTNSGATSSTSWLSSALTPNTQYTFNTSVTDSVGNTSTTSNVSRYTLANVPTSPSALATSQSQIAFSWNANSNPGSTEYYPVNSTSSTSPGWNTSTSVSFSGLTCGTSYSFTVKAHNAEGFETATTSPVSTETQACDPSSPTSLGSANLVDGTFSNSRTPTFTFSLSDPVASSTVRFEIQIATTSDFSGLVIDYTSGLGAQGSRSFVVGQAAGSGTYGVGSSATTLSDSGSGYYWRVKSINNSGFSSSYSTANSGSVAFKIDATAPTPGTLNLSATTTQAIGIILSGAADALSGLPLSPFVFWNITDNISIGPTASLSAYFANLLSNVSYTFNAVVSDLAGNSSTTPNASIHTLAKVPSNLVAADSQTQITLTWDSNGNSVSTEYFALNSTSSTSPDWSTGNEAVFSGLTCGTSYSFSVKARNADSVETAEILTTESTLDCDIVPPVEAPPQESHSGSSHGGAASQASGGLSYSPGTQLPAGLTPVPQAEPEVQTPTVPEEVSETPEVSEEPEAIVPESPESAPLFNFPDINLPDISLPDINLPDIDLSQIGENISEAAQNLVENIGENVSEVAQNIAETVGGAITESIGAISHSVGSIVERARSIPGREILVNLSTSLGTSATDAARFVVEKNEVLKIKIQEVGEAGSTAVLAVAPVTALSQFALVSKDLAINLLTAKDIYISFASVFQGFFVTLGIRKRRRHWGTVYDSITKQPLDPVIVELVNQETGKTVDQSITDLYGRFGFLDMPGRYKINAQKTNYKFPSTLVTGTTDGIFENVYHGEEFVISSEEGVSAPNIPMDPLAVDWNQEEKKRLGLGKINAKFENIIAKFFRFVFWAGFASIVVMAFENPTKLNVVFLLMYGLMIYIHKNIPSTQLWGRIESQAKSVYGLYVELKYPDLDVIIGKSYTNARGKFFLKAPEEGAYQVNIKKTQNDPNTLKTIEVKVGRDGVVKDVINLD